MHIAALGSSFAAGPSIPPQINAPARRSGSNYPSLLAAALVGSTTGAAPRHAAPVTAVTSAAPASTGGHAVAGGVTARVPLDSLRRAIEARLAALRAEVPTAVVAVSKESVKSHDRFRDKHGLGIPLLADESGAVVERFGLWGEKSMYGRTFMGVERATYLIDAAGIVRRIWPKVKVAGHVEEVLEAARAL